ncbi:Cu(I)-responsive transcriptional regulator [Rhizobium panacihumi]|uniref:Cu(I)-responsive transcriptional regulator n=1 Tax=Rhizobium panacihumi TaxID=2008450 RepID=UPI003D7AC58C
MNIGQAAEASGVSAKMIRYYEEIGLIAPPARTGNNYRVYGTEQVHVLRFIKRARSLGFSLEETETLLTLWQDKSRTSAAVKEVATSHINDLERRIAEMQGMVKTLKTLAHCCGGDHRPDCPILDDLAGDSTASADNQSHIHYA